ncbi:MAG: hypothetical protein MJ124_10345 [Lachnospiraceae bacterium]|nr:hypothetical protein [Lachnospiraceae bacterium]
MLSEERIKLMTRLASYDSGEGKKNLAIAKFFRSDYIGLQILKAVICATIAYMIAFAVYIYVDFENFMLGIYKLEIWDFAKQIIKYYVVFVVSYSLLVYIGFSFKYGKAKKNLKRYFGNLKLLNSIFAKEEGDSDR